MPIRTFALLIYFSDMLTEGFSSLLYRIYPSEHFKKKYVVDEVGYTDEVGSVVQLSGVHCGMYLHIIDSQVGEV